MDLLLPDIIKKYIDKSIENIVSFNNDNKPKGANFIQPTHILEPDLSFKTNGEPAIDINHVQDGYVVAQAISAARLKFQVRQENQIYNYDLPNNGTQTVYPLNMGNGHYKFRIMQNVSGNNYFELYSVETDVSLTSEFAPFLIANLYCNYNKSSTCVNKARELTKQVSNVAEAVKVICEFVAINITYDSTKAKELAHKSGYIPNPDETLATGKGICFDYTSLSAAMLRSLGIPTKIVTGYVGCDKVYHSWIMVYINGTWHSTNFIINPNVWSLCDITFASTGVTQFVGNENSYIERFIY